MPISQDKLYSILYEKFPDAQIKITDLAGDEDHYSLEISSNLFKNLGLLAQHKMVKEALSGILHKELHAITIKTKILD